MCTYSSSTYVYLERKICYLHTTIASRHWTTEVHYIVHHFTLSLRIYVYSSLTSSSRSVSLLRFSASRLPDNAWRRCIKPKAIIINIIYKPRATLSPASLAAFHNARPAQGKKWHIYSNKHQRARALDDGWSIHICTATAWRSIVLNLQTGRPIDIISYLRTRRANCARDLHMVNELSSIYPVTNLGSFSGLVRLFWKSKGLKGIGREFYL